MTDSPEITTTSVEGVGPRRQEKALPEVDKLAPFSDKLYYTYLRAITHKSRNLAQKGLDIERSRGIRRTRNKLKLRYYSIPKQERQTRKEIIAEAKTRDELELQFLNQGEVTVDIPNLGSQTSRYTIVDLPETQKSAQDLSKPPVVFIPGLSSGLVYGLDLIEELAFSGRRVISIGHPESSMGKVTLEFAKACESEQNYEPHATFFKEAIAKILSEEVKIELWGHSTGSAVISELLKDKQFSQKVTNAVLLSPASSVDQSALSLNVGIVKEIRDVIGSLPEYARFSFTPEGQDELKKRVQNAMFTKVRTKIDYSASHLPEGGKIIVVSGQKDNIVKSSQARQDFERNPQITFINWPGAYHATPMMKPEQTIDLVEKALNRP